jgi:hypothetical protein
MVSSTNLTGAAGEHYVMSQLLRRDFIAALAPVGVPNCDIVVTDEIGDRLCAVQVKTRWDKGSDGGWHMAKKHERLDSPTLFYCFVNFGKTATAEPACYVIPAAVVAETIATAHRKWLGQLGKKGQKRKDTDFRRLLPCYADIGYEERTAGWLDRYRDAWHLLTPATNTERRISVDTRKSARGVRGRRSG